MRTTWMLVAVALGIGGCAEGGSGAPLAVTLEGVSPDGAADSLWGRSIELDVRDEFYFEGRELDGTFEISNLGGGSMDIRGDLIVFRAGQERYRIAVEPRGIVESLASDLAFLLFYRRAMVDDAWSPVLLETVGPDVFGRSDPVTVNTFEWVDLDVLGGTFGFRDGGHYTPSDGATLPFPYLDIDYEVAVFVVPIRNRSFEENEEFAFRIEAECGFGACL